MKLVEIHKQRIASLLDEGLKNPVVLIEAPHGYSKRELVYQYVLERKVNFAWLRLRQMDNWLFFNWKHLIKELNKTLAKHEGDDVKLDQPASIGQIPEFIDGFEKALVNSLPIVLVIDDYSILKDEQVCFFYESLIEANIYNLHLLIISSEKIALEDHCSKSSIKCFFIGKDELKLTPLETKEYFASNQVCLTIQQAEKLTDKWQGWPLPILMLAKDHRGIAELEESPTDKVQLLFFFHYFNSYSKKVRNMLVRMSLIMETPLEVFDFLEEDEKKMIENNPLIYCDTVNGIFTLQIDYKKFLESRQILLSEEEKLDTYQKTGLIFIEREQLEDAIPLLIQATDYDRAIDLIWQLLNQYIDFSRIQFLFQQSSQLPQVYLSEHPRAILQQACLLIFLGEQKKSQSLLHSLIKSFDSGKFQDSEVVGEAYYLLFQIARMDGIENIVDYAQSASHYLPNGTRYWKDPVAVLIKALKIRFPAYDEDQPNQLSMAKETFKTINPYMTKIYGGKNVHLDLLCEAEIDFYTYRLKDARIKLLELLHLAEKEQIIEMVLLVRQYLLRIDLLKGNLTGADEQMSQIEALIKEGERYQYNGFMARSKSMMALCLRDPDNVHIRIKKNSIKQESKWELTRNGLTQARYLIHDHRYEDGIALLNYLQDAYGPYDGYWMAILYVKIFRAIAYARIGRQDLAIGDLHDAYRMTKGYNVITPFIEGEVDMRYLIDIAREEAADRFDKEWLDTIFTKANNLSRQITQQRKQKHAAEKTIELTPRRIEILQDLSKGLTAIEIADKRNIKESTVRTHIKNICNDLGAINRTNAVQIAASKGII
ncbi:LuxR C-terminal-related transcriptional regulator [Enterococcus sp.]|uniref:LuxR C-terminal-related transcriptional regulator n=1 Tax=Enterococcus sp. TaxID=35783 RepID=UPI0029125C2A|nr:LuxR C-terminal-related transcriptional regulator [Enterococcus sp.]MDU5334501.1 LuxR C-terminal-related transcriptional regulator [Enterococcus sp.]